MLPAFLIRDGGEWRPAQYETDLLSRIPWDDVDLSPLFDLELGAGDRDVALRAGLDAHPLSAHPGGQDAGGEEAGAAGEGAWAAGADTSAAGGIDYYFAASHLLDAMPNPWRGAEAARLHSAAR